MEMTKSAMVLGNIVHSTRVFSYPGSFAINCTMSRVKNFVPYTKNTIIEQLDFCMTLKNKCKNRTQTKMQNI